MTATGMDFGLDVIVAAEVVRVLATTEDDATPVWRQTASSRDSGRFIRHEWPDASAWPGATVPEAWSPPPAGFDPSPTPEAGDVFVRLRRLIFRVPEIGIVIGPSIRRQEGRILASTRPNEDAALVGPGRTLNLVEVALPPSSGRARIVIAHPRDLAPVGPT